MAYISIDEVTALAQTVIKEADDRDRNIWKNWVYTALLSLGIDDDEIKVAELIPSNGVAKLPDECRQIIEMSLFDTSGNQLNHINRAGKTRIYQNYLTDSFSAIDVSHDAYNIHLGTNADTVSKILLRYFAYPVDSTGNLMIREEDSMACIYFIRYMSALRADDNRSKIAQDQQSWFMEADRARARKKMKSMSPDKARSTMSMLVSMIPNFRSINGF